MKKNFSIILLLFIPIELLYPQWQPIGLQSETLTKVVIHPNDSQTLFAGSRSDFSSGSIGCFF
jgi:hypothetical protein